MDIYGINGWSRRDLRLEQSQHTSESKNANIEPTQHTQNQKPSMVAEPMIRYREVNSRENPNQVTFGNIINFRIFKLNHNPFTFKIDIQ